MLLTVVVVFACAAVSDVLKLGQTAGQDKPEICVLDRDAMP